MNRLEQGNKKELKLALAIYNLSNPSKELVIEMIELLRDYEDAEAFKAKTDGHRTGKQGTVPPGNPAIAALHLELEGQMRRENYIRKNNLQRMRKRINNILQVGRIRLVECEGKND